MAENAGIYVNQTTSVLYVTYDGITDHIGQSQVAPYLLGLAAKGHKITLLSAEKMEFADIISRYEKIFAQSGINWIYIKYHRKPPIFSTLLDLARMQKIAGRLIQAKGVKVIHCRSYVASLIGLHFKKRNGIKFIFDMRDFWADAGKETKRFNVDKNFAHKKVYYFFKRKEKEFLEYADHIISLTESGKRIMLQWAEKEMSITAPISVIPCCADFSFFDPDKIDPLKLEEKKRALGIPDGTFVLNYLGSLGPAYLTNELLDLYKVVLKRRPDALFLVVANNDHHLIKNAAIEKGIDINKLIITKSSKEEIPYLIALSHLSAFFIMPSFAKQACSPTKLAELFAMNVPVISNTKVGDLDTILSLDRNGSAVVHSFNAEELEKTVNVVMDKLEDRKVNIRNASFEFSVTEGINAYNKVYNSLS